MRLFFIILFTLLRSVALPIIALGYAQTTGLGIKPSFILVGISLTIVNVISILWQLLKIIPNLLFLKLEKVLGSIIRILIEVFSIIGFWYYFFININQLP